MPAADNRRKRPPARSRYVETPRPAQCTYREGGRRCVRNGVGEPPLCQRHLIAVREALREASGREHPLPGGNRIGNVADRFVKGKAISSDDLLGALAELAGIFAGSKQRAAQGQPFSPFSPFQPFSPFSPFQRTAQPPPPPPPEVLEKQEAIRRARGIFGFKAGEPVTVDELKRRRRDLSKKHHPDRGGSLGKMQEINHAHDILAAELG